MREYITRALESDLQRALKRAPAVAILGPRQCGKSTLAKAFIRNLDAVYLDLQKRSDRAKLDEPELYMDQHRNELVSLDEIQLLPEFFAFLRSEIDVDRRPGRFLILGSASRDLIRQSSESLAGRIAYLELTPFRLNEVACHVGWQRLWIRGGFPDSLLASDEQASCDWRSDFIQTFLERDIPGLGFSIPVPTMERLWRLLAHYHGQTVNFSKLAGAVDVSIPTLKKYLAILEQTYMVRLLPPCEANVKKRLVRSPKVYLRDSGLLHSLLEIDELDHLLCHPVMGASWEGLVLEHIIAALPGWRASFLRTSNGAEADVVMQRGDRTLLFECKCSKAPSPRRGFFELIDDVKPEESYLVAPVDEPYVTKRGVRVISLDGIATLGTATS